MEVLELAQEKGGERRVDDANEVCALALVHTRVIPRRIAVVTLCRTSQSRQHIARGTNGSPKALLLQARIILPKPSTTLPDSMGRF